jgi:two-component system OmpR family sensor kinase
MSPATAINPQRAPGFSNVGGWRVFTTTTSRPGFVLQTADSLPERHAIRLSAIALEAADALVCALVTLTIQRRMVRAELRPLRDFAAAVEQLDPPASSALEPTGREELEPIRASVETLTQRLLIRLDAEKAFSAHAAHALRTPLAGIDVQLALAMREASGPQAQHLHHARTGVARLSAVVSALLRLFRAGGSYQRVPLDAGADTRTRDQLSVTVTGEGELLGDRDLIAAALINLLANAEQHGGQSVTVHYRADEAGFTLCVTDCGAGLPARQRQEMQLALDEKRSHPNIGMGLELGRLVAEIHGGRLTLPDCEDGFRVCLSGRNGTTVAS